MAQLLDQYGNPITRRKPRYTDQIVHDTSLFRYSTYPSVGLTPESMAQVFINADRGYIQEQANLFNEMEEKDCHLQSVNQTRKLSVASIPFIVEPASKDNEDLKIAEACTELVENLNRNAKPAMLQNLNNINQDISFLILDMMDSVGKGFSGFEIIYYWKGDQLWIERLRFVNQDRFNFDGIVVNLEVPRLRTEYNQYRGIELPLYKFVIHRSGIRTGPTNRAGIFRPIAWYWYFKHSTLKHWMIFNELCSIPIRIANYEDPNDKTALFEALESIGIDFSAVIPDSTKIDFIQAKNSGSVDNFEKYSHYCDRGMTKAMLGHVGAAEGTPGKLGSEEMAVEVKREIRDSDANSVGLTITNQVFAAFVYLNFGPDKDVPKYIPILKEPEDQEKTASVYEKLYNIGFKEIPLSHIHKTFNIPIPEEGEKTLADTESNDQQANAIKRLLFKDEEDPNTKVDRKTKNLQESQDVVEQFKEDSLEEFDPKIMIPVLKPVYDLLRRSRTLTEFNARLAEAYPDMDDSAIIEGLTNSMSVNHMWGRLNADGKKVKEDIDLTGEN